MALLSLGGVCLLLRCLAAASGDDVPVISLTKNESSQVLLDCSLGSEGIRVKKFDWKVNGTKEVFLYDDGDVYTEDPQFKGRVQHESRDSNNASIIISNALVKDTGIYECIYIDETNQKTTKSRISLTVGCILKDRTEEKINGVCRKPYIDENEVAGVSNLDHDRATVSITNLKCEIEGAFPKPTIEWQDSARKPIKDAVETKSEQKEDGRFDLILEINVTQSGDYYCVVTQEEICHQIERKKTVKAPEPSTDSASGPSTDPGSHSSLVAAVVVLVLLLLVIVVLGCWCHCKKMKALKLKYISAGARMTS